VRETSNVLLKLNYQKNELFTVATCDFEKAKRSRNE
jgi:hypothetical protein